MKTVILKPENLVKIWDIDERLVSYNTEMTEVTGGNCAWDHPDGGALDLTQRKKIFDFSHEYGVDINAAEFMNEPNMLSMSGAHAGYTAADYARDQDIFNKWVKENYPDCILVGPCTLGDAPMGDIKES